MIHFAAYAEAEPGAGFQLNERLWCERCADWLPLAHRDAKRSVQVGLVYIRTNSSSLRGDICRICWQQHS